MAKNSQLKISKRELSGRKVKQLRREGIIPANIFGKKIKSLAIQVAISDLKKSLEEVGETSLLDLVVEDEKSPRSVLVSSIHKHPVTSDILHVDFHQVDLTQKVTATVPLEFTGESAAVKDLGGVLNSAFREVEVEALPADLPENIEIDLSSLAEIGNSIFAKDLKISSKIKLELEPDTLLVSVIEAKEEAEPEPAEEDVEAEAEGQESQEEGKEEDKKEEKPAEAKPEAKKE